MPYVFVTNTITLFDFACVLAYILLHSENGRTFKLSLLLIVLYHQQEVVEDIQPEADVITNTFVEKTDAEHTSSQISNCSIKRKTEGLNVDCSNRG